MSCLFDDLSPGGTNCSSNGICVSGECFCDSGWRSIGDFALNREDCDLHVLSIRVLWGFGLIGCTGLFILSAYYLYAMLVVLKSYKPATLWFTVGCLFVSILFALLSILKVADIDGHSIIGKDWLPTILFSLGIVLYFSLGVVVFQRFANVAYLQARTFGGDAIVAFGVPVKLCVLFLVLLGVTPILCALDNENHRTYARLYFFVCGIFIFFLGIFWNRIFVRRLISQVSKLRNSDGSSNRLHKLQDDSSMSEFDALLKRLKQYEFGILQMALSNGLMALLFGSWTFLVRKTAYQLPVGWGGAGFVGIYSLYVMCHSETTKLRDSKSASKASSSDNNNSKFTKLNHDIGVDISTKNQPFSTSVAGSTYDSERNGLEESI